MKRKIYALNEKGQALLKTLCDPYSEFYIDAVIDLEEKMESEDMPSSRAQSLAQNILTK